MHRKSVRLSNEDIDLIDKASKIKGFAFATFIREAAVGLARRLLGRKQDKK